MGWYEGSLLMSDVIHAARRFPNGRRSHFYRQIIEAFENHDADGLSDCLGVDPEFDEAYYDLYPEDEWFEAEADDDWLEADWETDEFDDGDDNDDQ
jgi:hypothetical protein